MKSGQNFAVLSIVLAIALVGLYVWVAGGGFPLDDSWIHQVYARNLAQNGEWSFVPGQPSGGSTSPLYTVLLALGYALGVPYAAWTHGLGALALAAAGVLGFDMARRLANGRVWVAVAAGLALVLAWHLVWAAASGMETMLFSTWTLALVWLVWREFDARRATNSRAIAWRGALFGLVAALTVMTRPEGALLAGLAGLSIVGLRPQGWRAAVTWGGGAALAFAVCIAPYLALNVHLTGGLLPNTSAAKQAQHAPLLALPFARRFADMLLPVLVGGQLLLLPGVVAFIVDVVRRARRNPAGLVWLLPLLWALGLLALYAARLPAAYQHGRYVIPALPGVMVIGVVGTAQMIGWMRGSMAGRVISRGLAAAAAVTFMYFGLVMGPQVYRQDVAIIDEEMVTPAQWIADNLLPGDLLAIHDIGAVGYFAPRPLLDIAGLVTPEVVARIGDGPALWTLVREREASYLMAFPDQIPPNPPADVCLRPRFQSDGEASSAVGGPKMVVYALEWGSTCVD